MKLRVLLADDHAMVREALAMLIGGQPDMEVVGQAVDGGEAVQLARETRPDIAVLDLSMPVMGGADVASRLRDECPETRVVALTRHPDAAYVRALLRAGAAGYVLKKSASDTLIQALRTVARGELYVEPSLAGALLQRTFTQAGAPLTGREEEVLRGVAWGYSNKEIATKLGISVKTVESYKAEALEKLGLRTRYDIVRHAISRGWLSAEGSPE